MGYNGLCEMVCRLVGAYYHPLCCFPLLPRQSNTAVDPWTVEAAGRKLVADKAVYNRSSLCLDFMRLEHGCEIH